MGGNSNASLNASKNEKKNEFYTKLKDIEKELEHYDSEVFRDKIVFLNCDDPLGKKSNFWFYFKEKFEYLGLKRLVAIHYEARGLLDIIKEDFEPPYKLEIYRDDNGEIVTEKTVLTGDGDYKGKESTEVLKTCDIVVTNPPFSELNDFLLYLHKYDKKFIIIGNINVINNVDIFPLVYNSKFWYGYKNPGMEFVIPEKFYTKGDSAQRQDSNGVCYKKLGIATWFTNLDHDKRHELLTLYKKYNKKDYPTYDNYDAIEVDKTANIPKDFLGVMGVPISFMSKFNPTQFEIVGNESMLNISKGRGYVNGKRMYGRIFIKRKLGVKTC